MPTKILLLPPPGPPVLNFAGCSLSSLPTLHPPIPLFSAAHAIRWAVFIEEQHYSAANEVDANDARSWHWVAMAEPRGADGKVAEGTEEPVGTIRLIPVSEHGGEGEVQEGPGPGPTELWDGREPYVTLGRLATLSSHRGLGIGKQLVNSALQWAGANASVLRRKEPEEGGGGKGGVEEEKEEKEEGNENNGWDGLVLVHAQVGAEGFYARLGFVTDGGLERWLEEGEEHLAMWKRLEVC